MRLETQIAEPSVANMKRFHESFLANGGPEGMPGLISQDNLEFRSIPLQKADELNMKDEPYLILDSLTVLLSSPREDVGAILVKNGLKTADRYGFKLHVMAIPAGLNLYLDHGFEFIETVLMDYSTYGGAEPMVYHFWFDSRFLAGCQLNKMQ